MTSPPYNKQAFVKRLVEAGMTEKLADIVASEYARLYDVRMALQDTSDRLEEIRRHDG